VNGVAKALVSGKWTESQETISVLNKYTEKPIDSIPSCSAAHVEAALESAERGVQEISRMLGYERATVLERTADVMESDVEDLAQTLVKEAGMPIKIARVEVKRSLITLRFSADEARRISGETIPFDAQQRGADRYGYYIRKPVGIVAAITSFNGPLLLVCRKIGPAIAAGNSSVLKPASATPLSALNVGEMLLEQGLPTQALQILTGRGDVIGRRIASDPRVRVVSLTGGSIAGADIAAHAGVKRLVMELGSICPTIVMDDARLDLALSCLPDAAFSFAGQNCIRPQRVFIHESVYEEFKEEFVERSSKLRVGDPAGEQTDVGPMISERESARVHELVQEASRLGAVVLMGGSRKGPVFFPTILEKVPPGAKVLREEIFGPVTLVESFSRLSEAIAKSNETPYGLQAGIFTQNIDTAYRAIANLNFGAVLVNDTSDFNSDLMPFGGVKQSGIGREGVRWAVEGMTEIRTVIYRVPPT
jgi:glyceraldehyde-3-phosphate dehydrogenase (NADP+)